MCLWEKKKTLRFIFLHHFYVLTCSKRAWLIASIPHRIILKVHSSYAQRSGLFLLVLEPTGLCGVMSVGVWPIGWGLLKLSSTRSTLGDTKRDTEGSERVKPMNTFKNRVIQNGIAYVYLERDRIVSTACVHELPE